jgi:hypothetical protein
MLLLGSTGSSGLEPTKDRVALLLAPLLVLSWWVEYRVIRRRTLAPPRAVVIGAVGVANLLSYGVIMAGVQWTAFFPDIAPSYTTRAALLGSFIQRPEKEHSNSIA